MPAYAPAEIVPKNAGTFGIFRDTNFIGGCVGVANAAARLALEADHRKVPMLVLEADTHELWELTQLSPAVWVQWTGGGGVPISYLQTTILWSAVSPAGVSIGSVPAGRMASFVDVQVVDVFNDGTQMTVGTDLAQGELMAAADNDLSIESSYGIDAFQLYAITTEIKAFFPVGTPTAGELVVTVLVA